MGAAEKWAIIKTVISSDTIYIIIKNYLKVYNKPYYFFNMTSSR